MNQQRSHQAIQWFVLNESGRAQDEEIAQRWNKWRADPINRTEYTQVLQLVEDLRELAPPTLLSGKVLQKDAALREAG